ncbi:hypothetical protein AGMMS49928_06890 [Spirochaetia bacterium]|nr:hypothetical protein AGMMS49928_06890 [Spirochaetia bacterium]
MGGCNMARIYKTALVCLAVLLSSCAISKAIYLGEDSYSLRAGPQSSLYNTADINGVFPEAVYIKTKTQSFNLYHYYLIHEGKIWYKSIDPEKGPADWTLFAKTGLPRKAERIAEISADADELVALTEAGEFYRYCFDRTIAHKSNTWLDKQGWPGEEQLFLDRRTAKNLSWAIGKRNAHVLYYEDPFGNQHHNGTMEVVTTYMLLEDGQEICYADPGLPTDFSRNYIGPERGTFKALTLSASASTMFVINKAGLMYTRLADFDVIGSDSMFFKYTYTPYTSDLPGTDYFSNLNEWGLPAEDWRSQPRIPLTGKAAITGHITILQNGQGNAARELRVAGLDEEGRTGYWTKAIFDETWEFKTAPLYFDEDAFLSFSDEGEEERGSSADKFYSGLGWKNNERETGWEYAIPNFNILEGDCDFRITRWGETCTLILHPVEMWTYLKRDYLPGRTGAPKMFWATLEIPPNAFDGLSESFARELAARYGKKDRVLFNYTITASDRFIIMRDSDDEEILYLTDGTLSPQYPEFHPIHYVENYEEIKRYFSAELSLNSKTAPTKEELERKIELNKTFRDELRRQIRTLKWAGLTVFKMNFGYLPAHYIARYSPLRFVDLPKIRTITEFGNRVVLENSSFISTVSDARIWVDEKIIALLDLRILYYEDLANGISHPYSETTSGWWDIAGLPRSVSGHSVAGTSVAGHFFTMNSPAILTFVPPQTDTDLYGWYFQIRSSASSPGTGGSFSFFIVKKDLTIRGFGTIF